MKQFIFTGHTTKDLELKTTKNDKYYTILTLAINSYNSQTKETETEFYDISVFDKRAESLAKHVGKGSNLMVQGTIKKSFITGQDGKKTYYTNFIANIVEVMSRKNPAGYKSQTESIQEESIDSQINGFDYPIDDIEV